MISRHSLPSSNNYELTIGYDPGLDTFFAQVVNPEADESAEDQMVLWIGTSWQEIPDVNTIVEAVRPFAAVPLETIDQLEADREREQHEQTPLQKLMRGFFVKANE